MSSLVGIVSVSVCVPHAPDLPLAAEAQAQLTLHLQRPTNVSDLPLEDWRGTLNTRASVGHSPSIIIIHSGDYIYIYYIHT